MLTADASRGAFLSGFTVVAVPLMAGLCGTAKLKRSTWAAVGAALVGISLLEDSGAPASWGDFWSFASAVLFGAQVGAQGCGAQLRGRMCMPEPPLLLPLLLRRPRRAAHHLAARLLSPRWLPPPATLHPRHCSAIPPTASPFCPPAPSNRYTAQSIGPSSWASSTPCLCSPCPCS